MRALSRVGVGLAVVSALLLLALTAELYYIFVHKRRLRRRAAAISDASSSPSSSSRELLQLFCFKKPPALASTYAVPEAGDDADADDETVEAQLMRLGGVVGPTRLLFTIKEETREDLESEDGRGRSRSLGELMHCSETPPFLTPRASPSPAMDNSYNPLFESPAASPGPRPGPTVSPPPMFQFLKDAEEKLYRRALAEEAMRARRSPPPQQATSPAAGEEDGGYITIMVGKNSRVIIPVPSAPATGGGRHE
ncbi:hypothetical protein Zm00014a_016616 [Zea mays]|jgi:hypothetical protein|uniref:Membrane lipoprotein n=2 Tax=Zea mays TaxID=4577 RepID=A0A8J8YG26_MAIZE|nr:uncharacterized protein LOC100273663 [Zea mays]ACF86597.1 unknown [Zea mays]ACG44768.1 hypothetical protein [Zea mays]AQK84517.1 Putative membrane lipoprotein [Zea mays]PWZ52949.1 hypothetical protein Zm00014a_016616 [Zea mays]|eukprot:NP_001141548.1 uncharacterized protein LOC100273663 [Zea mays]